LATGLSSFIHPTLFFFYFSPSSSRLTQQTNGWAFGGERKKGDKRHECRADEINRRMPVERKVGTVQDGEGGGCLRLLAGSIHREKKKGKVTRRENVRVCVAGPL
jgi:hypothetical protein